MKRACQAIVVSLLVAATLSGCGAKGKLEDQKFVSVQEAAQWIVNNECDHSGAQQGYPGYDMESGGIGHIDFMCDNGSTYSIDHYKDGFFRGKQTKK
jgi:predicted small lipoprotein YifL